MKIIAVSNQKGGVGKTTTSVNFAAALALEGKRVLVVDTDPQGNATTVLLDPADERRTLYNVLAGQSDVDGVVAPTRIKGLSIIAASHEMAGAEIEVARMEEPIMQLRNIFQPLRERDAFDYVLIDCPPSLGIWMSNALVAADEVLVPIQCEYYALEGLSLIMHVMEQIRTSGANPGLALAGLLMTMLDLRTNLNVAVVRDVRAHFENVVFETVIPRSVRIAEAPSHGKTVLEHDPLGPGSQAYTTLAKEFIARQAAGMSFAPPSSQG